MKSPSIGVIRAACLFLGLFPIETAVAGDNPAGSTDNVAPTDSPMPPPAMLELRGVLQTPRGPIFRIYDKQTDSASWLGANEAGPGYFVKGYRILGGVDQVTVNYHGKDVTLTIRRGAAAAAPGKAGPVSIFGGSKTGPEDTFMGVPLSELRPDEMSRLQILIAQVRTRVNREKRAETTPPDGEAP